MIPSPKRALITGASRGIGAAIAKRLAADDFHVILNFSSSSEKAKILLEEIQSAGGSGELCGFDVSNSQEVEEKIDALGKAGPIGVLVNNAGISIDALLMRLKDDDLDRTLDIDLKGAIYCTRSVTRQMMKAREGSIIFISSVVGEAGSAGQTAYAAAKAGMIGFAKSVAKELASRQIRANVVTPGYIETDMTGALTEAQKDAILRSVPLGFIGIPDDVAALVSYLASSESRYVTGQVIGVNGGLYI